MKRLCTALLLLLVLAHPALAQETLPSIVVQADSTLSLPLAHIVREYAKQKKVAVALGFHGVETDTTQEGSSADVLITANAAWLDLLKQQGLVDIYSEVPIAQDRLVLVSPLDSRLTADLNKEFPTGRLIMEMGKNPIFLMGNPETLVEGRAGRDALHSMKASADLEPYTLFQKDRRTMHDMIRQSGAYGVLLASDAHQQQLRVVSTFPKQTHAPIVYKAVVLASENMNAARRFIDFLKSSEARALLTGYGLDLP